MKITKIAGYSATSTECSDYSLRKKLPKKVFFFLQKCVVFCWRGIIKGSEQTTRG